MTNIYVEHFCTNVKKLRLAAKLDHAELAKRIYASESYIEFIEDGKATPTLDAAVAIATALNCSINDLLQ